MGHTLIASLQIELRDDVAQAFQEDVLEALEATRMKGLVIDISGLETVDTFVARVLVDTGLMAKLMGTATVLVGMRPEIAATLVRMGYAMEGVRTALDLEEGLKLFENARRKGKRA
jgi:rsbT antagonist protein RsbS